MVYLYSYNFKINQTTMYKSFLKFAVFIWALLLLNTCEMGNPLNISKSENGIQTENIVLDVNGTEEQRNIFTYGELITLKFKNVTGLQKENGKVFPQGSIFVLNEKQDTIDRGINIFGEEGMDDDPLNLTVQIQAGLAQNYNKQYTLKVEINDAKGEGSLQMEMPITIIENERFVISTDSIQYKAIYLLDKTTNTVIVDNKVNKADGVVILYEGLKGLQTDEINYVYPGMSIKLVDNSGKVILENENMLDTYNALGFKSANIEQRLPINIAFKEVPIENPVKLTATLFDLKSDRQLVLETDLEVN